MIYLSLSLSMVVLLLFFFGGDRECFCCCGCCCSSVSIYFACSVHGKKKTKSIGKITKRLKNEYKNCSLSLCLSPSLLYASYAIHAFARTLARSLLVPSNIYMCVCARARGVCVCNVYVCCAPCVCLRRGARALGAFCFSDSLFYHWPAGLLWLC